MLSIILGFVFFCLVVWCFFALAACGLLQIIVYAASFLIGLWILAFANTGLLVIISPTTSTRCDSALLPLLRVP